MLEGPHPVEQVALPGVGGKAADGEHLGVHRHVFVEQPDGLRAVHDLAARRAHALVTHEHDGRPLPPQVVAQVVLDAARVAHAAGRNDDRRAFHAVQRLRFLAVQGVAQVGQGQRVFSARVGGLQVVIVEARVLAKDFRGADGQGAVDVHRHVGGQFAVLPQHVQGVQHLLGALHRESGNDHLFAVAVAVGDGFRQFGPAVLGILVVAVAVGGFHEQVVRPGGVVRVVDDELVGPPQVAGKHQPGGRAVFRHLYFKERGTQDVPGVLVGNADARRGLERGVVFHGAQLAHGLHGVCHGVQRLHRLAPAEAALLAGFPLRFHFLDVGGILQHDVHQVARGRGAVDVALEAFARHARQKAGVVDVGVGDEKEGDVAGAVDVRILVALVDFGVALVHAAVDREAGAVGLKHVARAGNGLRGPQKLYVHAFPLFR